MQPPDRSEALDDDYIVNGLFDPKAVVNKPRLSEFKELALAFPLPRKLVSGIIFADLSVINHTTGITYEPTRIIVQRNRHATFEKSTQAHTKTEMPDCLRREAPACEIGMLRI